MLVIWVALDEPTNGFPVGSVINKTIFNRSNHIPVVEDTRFASNTNDIIFSVTIRFTKERGNAVDAFRPGGCLNGRFGGVDCHCSNAVRKCIDRGGLGLGRLHGGSQVSRK